MVFVHLGLAFLLLLVCFKLLSVSFGATKPKTKDRQFALSTGDISVVSGSATPTPRISLDLSFDEPVSTVAVTPAPTALKTRQAVVVSVPTLEWVPTVYPIDTPRLVETIEESTKYRATQRAVNQDIVNYRGVCDDCEVLNVQVDLFAYDPSAGDEYCLEWVDGVCLSDMYSGLDWRVPVYHDFAIACPVEWSIYSYVDVENVGRFQCLDRGSSVVCEGDVCRVAILSEKDYGGVYEAVVYERTD